MGNPLLYTSTKRLFYTCMSVYHTKAALPCSFESTNAYTNSLRYTWHTYQISFHDQLCVHWHSWFGSSLAPSKNLFRCYFFFAYSRRPLLGDMNIYTCSLMPYNSLNIDTKLDTILISRSCMAKNIGFSVAQHCVNSWYANTGSVQINFFKFQYVLVH